MNNIGRITLRLPENCLTFSNIALNASSVVNSADTDVTEESPRTRITTNDLHNFLNELRFDGTITLPVPPSDKFSSVPCNNFGIRIKWLEESTENVINHIFKSDLYLCRTIDLLYYCGVTKHQGVIREYLIEKYNFTPDIGYQLLPLDIVDLLQITDRLKHTMPNYRADRLLLKQIIWIKRIVRRLSQLPDLKVFYWESECYESF